VQQLMSSVRRVDEYRQEEGFTLIEMVCVVAVLAIVAAIAMPWMPRGTSRAALESYAVQTATLLKTDRNAALRRHTVIATEVNARSRSVRSGASGRIVQVPSDVAVEALLTARCNGSAAPQIQFFPSGMSCGGVIAMSRAGIGYQIRVNWLTGGIDVVPLNQT
jgi:general secretion pathway protein H